MFNWIVSYTSNLEPFNFDSSELLGIELFDDLTVCKQMIGVSYT